MTHRHHEHGAGRAAQPLAFGVLTISDTRTEADNLSGRALGELVVGAGHRIHARAIVPDEPPRIREVIAAWAEDQACDAVVASGGTGLSPRDQTLEAVGPLFDPAIPGFGELFRALSYQEIGSAAMLSRAAAGIVRGTPVFLLPGSPKAVALAMERLVLPEVGHVVAELRRPGARP